MSGPSQIRSSRGVESYQTWDKILVLSAYHWCHTKTSETDVSTDKISGRRQPNHMLELGISAAA